jgi:GTP-binding protein
MSSPLPMVFVAATVDAGQLPESDAEVVFLGRSNVGKSSLLNALANRKDLAHVSKTPGRTQVLALFRLEPGDCPGYGYAKAPKGKRETWLPMIEDYLQRREPLRMVLLLVDGEIGPTASDLNMLGWLRESELPLTVVATKSDRVKPSQRRARQREVAEKCRLAEAEVVWASATESNGVDRLRDLVRGWLQDDGR